MHAWLQGPAADARVIAGLVANTHVVVVAREGSKARVNSRTLAAVGTLAISMHSCGYWVLL